MRRGATTAIHQPREGDDPRQRPALYRAAEGAFQPHDAHGAARQPAGLLGGGWGAWSVAITSIVPSVQAAHERLAVGTAAQRRVHLEAPLLAQILVAQHQIVRRRLATHGQSGRLWHGAPVRRSPWWRRGRHGTGSRSFSAERDVALDLPPLALRTDAPDDRARGNSPRRGYIPSRAGRRPRSGPRPASACAARRIASSIRPSACTPRPSSEKPTTSGASAAKSTSSPQPRCPIVMQP